MRILFQTSSSFFSNLFYLKRYLCVCVLIHPLLVVHPCFELRGRAQSRDAIKVKAHEVVMKKLLGAVGEGG